jgi:hypothetical protein
LSRRRPAAAAVAWLLAAAAALGLTGTADAAWSASAQGTAGAAALTMPTPATPTADTTGFFGDSVVLDWSGTQTAGVPVEGYEVGAYDADTGLPRAVGAGCDGLITGTTCTETSVPAGSWRYAVTARLQSWSGPESELSDPVDVGL